MLTEAHGFKVGQTVAILEEDDPLFGSVRPIVFINDYGCILVARKKETLLRDGGRIVGVEGHVVDWRHLVDGAAYAARMLTK